MTLKRGDKIRVKTKKFNGVCTIVKLPPKDAGRGAGRFAVKDVGGEFRHPYPSQCRSV